MLTLRNEVTVYKLKKFLWRVWYVRLSNNVGLKMNISHFTAGGKIFPLSESYRLAILRNWQFDTSNRSITKKYNPMNEWINNFLHLSNHLAYGKS